MSVLGREFRNGFQSASLLLFPISSRLETSESGRNSWTSRQSIVCLSRGMLFASRGLLTSWTFMRSAVCGGRVLENIPSIRNEVQPRIIEQFTISSAADIEPSCFRSSFSASKHSSSSVAPAISRRISSVTMSSFNSLR